MRFVIERWDETAGAYEKPVVGEGRGDEESVTEAFDDAGITLAGCYRVRPEADPAAAQAYYELTVDGLAERGEPCEPPG